ncbi:ATP-sensitive inward rectifier potassium channel 12-like isoform X2 [Rhodnius prolixus]|uniref:ATP-sensitive inward rectifier potassium channel 12-like isoform X2 n=1 Tax=Rhodnius prolixus TaxID=13249 RepID=UPI003D18D58F
MILINESNGIPETTNCIDAQEDINTLELMNIEQKRSSAKTNLLRTVRRSGHCNMKKKRRTARINHFTTDLFTSMVDSRWRNILLMLVISFVISWFIFALFWWLVAYAHGDLKISPYKNEGEPCVTLVDNLVSAFLFSVESQYTTGYGSRSPTTECPETVFILTIQCIFGVVFQSVMIGFVFTKICRPKGRLQAILFSEKAVICCRDGALCLMFRLGDERKSHVIDCKIRAWFLQHAVSTEGEILLHHQKKLKVSVDEGGEDIFLLWPVTVVHKIDIDSPFYNMSPEDIHSTKFEVVTTLVCTTDTTGRLTEARCSYTPNEILWGHRFRNIITSCDDGLEADYGLFNCTEPVDTTKCSARRFTEISRLKSES